jgi:hypothetical protein
MLDDCLDVPGKRHKGMFNCCHSKVRIIQMAEIHHHRGSLFFSVDFKPSPTYGSPETPNSLPGPLLQLFSRNRGIHHLMCLLHQLPVQLQQGRLGSGAVAASEAFMGWGRLAFIYIYIHIIIYIYKNPWQANSSDVLSELLSTCGPAV